MHYREVLGVRVRVAGGHAERRAAQQAGHVAGIAEVPQQPGEVAQRRTALFLVLPPGRRGRRLAAVLLMHAGRDVPGGRVLPVVTPDRQHGKPGDVEQLGLRRRQPAGGGEPQARGLVGGHRLRAAGLVYPCRGGGGASPGPVPSLAAIGCGPSGLSIHVEGASPQGSCQVPSAARPSSALRWKPARDGRKPRSGAAPRGATSSALITRRRSPGAIGEYPLPPFPPGRSPSGIIMIAPAQSRPNALRMPYVSTGRTPASAAIRARPGPSGSTFSKKSRPRMSRGPAGVPIGSPTERTGLPSPHRSIPSARHSSWIRNSGPGISTATGVS